MSSLGDLLEFTKTPNASTPFSSRELDLRYKTDIQYHNFVLSNTYYDECPWKLPNYWGEDGHAVPATGINVGGGCYGGDFDQFGDSGAFDETVEVYQRQLTKFSAAQDRLREWNPAVLRKIMHFSCLMIRMLDIDGYRIDKALQVSVEAQAEFSRYIRRCAREHDDKIFLIVGEVVSESGIPAVYFGRGQKPDMLAPDSTSALERATSGDDSKYL